MDFPWFGEPPRLYQRALADLTLNKHIPQEEKKGYETVTPQQWIVDQMRCLTRALDRGCKELHVCEPYDNLEQRRVVRQEHNAVLRRDWRSINRRYVESQQNRRVLRGMVSGDHI